MSNKPNGKPFVDRKGSSSKSVTPPPQNTTILPNGYEEGESSVSGSQRSTGSSAGQGRAFDNVTFEHEGINGGPKEERSDEQPRRRSWKSGGFLLDSSRSQKGFHLFSRDHKHDFNTKGKGKNVPADLVVPKNRSRTSRHQKALSHGSSPLATHVASARDRDHRDKTNSSIEQPETNSRHSLTSKGGQNGAIAFRDESERNHQIPGPALGFDTDPAQIVNMALRLNESRRRIYSGTRVVSGSQSSNRVHSGNYASPRDRDRRIASVSSKPQSRASVRLPEGFENEEAITGQSLTPTGSVEHEEDSYQYDVSDATFARAEKAKNYFELLYEYRRLLPHLPPLRNSATFRARDGDLSNISPEISRQYNPLQYVRNRRIRFREKQPLHPEEDGWHELKKVRAWINAVIEDHNQPRNDPDQCLRLPPLQDRPQDPQDLQDPDQPQNDSASSSIKQRTSNTPTKPRRPRQDLIFHPGDLLADAYWLEQGLNKTKIEDKEGTKLYPSTVGLKFDGWRNRTPLHEQELPKTSLELRQSAAPAAAAVPDLPEFTSSSRKHAKKGQQNRRRALRNSLGASQGSDSGSRNRSKKLLKYRRPLNDSSESSSESDSKITSSRGRSKISRHDSAIQTSGRSAFERMMLDMLNADSERRDSVQLNRSGFNKEISPSASEDRRKSKASVKELAEALPRTSYEDNTTAPSSPAVDYFPSIAINLSPPASRSPSPKKKPLQDRINPFNRDQSASKRRMGIESTDFADNKSQDGGSRTASNEEKLPPALDYSSSRGTSPFSKRTSLAPDEPIRPIDLRRTQSTIGKNSSNSGRHDPSSRFRGIFKGGRIAELVGSEVSRVGDFIWKREAPVESISANSSAVNSATDTEEEEVLKTPPSRLLRRFQTESNANGLSPQRSREERPQYHMNNLPSFTSPFKKDREDQERIRAPKFSPTQDTDDDPISRQLREMRSHSRSPRFDRLAPPRINVSPSPSSPESHRSGPDHRNSYGFGKGLDFAGTSRASDSLNNALDLKGGAPPVTGLASLNPSHSKSPIRGRPRLQGADSTSSTRTWSLSAQNPQTTPSEIARLRALLLSSGIKAREIHRRSHTVRHPPPPFLASAFYPSPSPSVIRREEHVYASRALINSLTSSSMSFRNDLSHFSTSITPSLHARIQSLTDLVENTINPRIRAAGDDAGELSQKLTTSSTLAVKQLGDTVEAVRRRRKRRLRWVRQLGYVIVEWMVVGILWWVWLVVMIWKVVKGTVWGMGRAVRWAFFL
ncbi:MAG: hypothetical protein Q9160_006133 [Pyrenula sp. 1 TL-2023]